MPSFIFTTSFINTMSYYNKKTIPMSTSTIRRQIKYHIILNQTISFYVNDKI